MARSEILQKVNDIFIETLDNNQIKLNDETTVFDIEEWDSLAHIQLVVAIEKEFNIRFNSTEIQNWNNVGEMLDSIEGKMQ